MNDMNKVLADLIIRAGGGIGKAVTRAPTPYGIGAEIGYGLSGTSPSSGMPVAVGAEMASSFLEGFKSGAKKEGQEFAKQMISPDKFATQSSQGSKKQQVPQQEQTTKNTVLEDQVQPESEGLIENETLKQLMEYAPSRQGILGRMASYWGGIDTPEMTAYKNYQATKGQVVPNVIKSILEAQTVPLSEEKKQEIGMKGYLDIQKELIKKGNPDALTPENSAKFSALMEGKDSVVEIGDILFKDISSAGNLVVQNKLTPSFFKSQISRKLEAAVERAVQAKTRAETGAALAPSELKNTSKRYIPRIGDSIGTMKSRLQPLFGYFDRAISIADPTGIHRQRAMSNEAIYSELNGLMEEAKRRGLRYG